jgi:hypothetical protein
MFRRTQRVTDQRIAAERDSSEDRESRKTARREQVAREEAREESLSAQKRREAELAEIRQRVAGLDSEIAYRLAVWRDSLDAIGSLVPQALRREAGFYERTENACRRFLGPRRTLVADLRMNTTYQIISERQGKDPQRDVERAMTYLIAITVDPNARSFVGVSHSWTNPDTLIVQMRPLFSENMERVPLSAVVEAISLPRWRKQLDKQ